MANRVYKPNDQYVTKNPKIVGNIIICAVNAQTQSCLCITDWGNFITRSFEELDNEFEPNVDWLKFKQLSEQLNLPVTSLREKLEQRKTLLIDALLILP